MGDSDFRVAKDSLAQTSLLIVLDRDEVIGPSVKLKIGVYANGRRIETVNTVFAGPRNQ